MFLAIKYNWLWKSDKDEKYSEFSKTAPSIDDYERQLRYFGSIQGDINGVSSIHIIGALSLNAKHLKLHLDRECDNWKVKVSSQGIKVLSFCLAK